MFDIISLVLLAALVFFLVVVILYRKRFLEILSQKKSSEVRLGQIAEHLVPFLEKFNYDPKQARFIGMPVDYIIFEKDKVIFLEVKTGKARLNKTQARIKTLIKEGKVTWEEIRLEPKN